MSQRRFLLLAVVPVLAAACHGGDKDTNGVVDTDTGDTGNPVDTGETDSAETGDSTETGDTETGDTETGDTGAADVFAVEEGEVPVGTDLTLSGLVLSSPNTGYGFFLQDPGGGAYSGIWVYYGGVTDTTLKASLSALSQGQVVDLSGTVNEYTATGGSGTLTEFTIGDTDALTVVGVTAPPEPTDLTTAQLADPTVAEPYESTLVRVSDVTVADGDIGFGEWTIDDGVIVDSLFYDPTSDLGNLKAGDTFTSITGPLYYSYDAFKIVPRDASDLEGYVKGPLTCTADLCADMLSYGDLVISEVMANPDACPDPDGEYFEIYNTSGESVDLDGLSLTDATGSYAVAGPVVVPPRGYAWMANGTYTTDYCYLSAGTPAYFYSSSLQLGNSGDTIDLAWSDGAVDTLIDEVIYTAASTGRGVAYGLNPDKMDADANDDEANWCAQTTVIGTTADYGTPGAANDPCPTGVGDTGG